MAKDRAVHPDCPNASNPFHVCAEYCVNGPAPRSKILGDKEISVPNDAGGKENGQKVEGGIRKVEGGIRKVEVGIRKVDPLCVNASNPFHQCTEYCNRRGRDGKSPSKGVISDQKKESVVIVDNRKVNPSCPNASNPFHQCAEYCSQKSVDQHKRGNSVSGGSSGRRSLTVAERKDVNPACANASNPFHKCAEYCSQTRKTSRVS